MSTNPDTTVVLEEDYLEAARTLVDNAATRARLDAEDSKAKEILAKQLTDGETGIDPHGNPMVKMTPGALVFDEKTARANLDQQSIALIEVTETVTRLDRTKAKDILAPALYRLACRQNKSSIKPVTR